RDANLGDEERGEILDVIANQGHEIATIVDDLLTASRVEIGRLNMVEELVALRDEVKAVIEPMEAPIPCDGDDDVTALADPARVRQIIRNLVNNARKYGGPQIRVVVRTYSSTAILEVRDSGGPLPAHEREAIFERYYRARQTPGVAGSVGLGLSVSRTLARNMGGELAYDHDGTESIFRLTLRAA
ncbi:MAG: HAMP domain-containing histidine kinase, partial [Acidimicrobiia bacterium]|nr:HAMP domain-containing histidine kinase [Acidimicrobiia bacterium]